MSPPSQGHERQRDVFAHENHHQQDHGEAVDPVADSPEAAIVHQVGGHQAPQADESEDQLLLPVSGQIRRIAGRTGLLGMADDIDRRNPDRHQGNHTGKQADPDR